MSKQALEKRLYVVNLKIEKTTKNNKSSFFERLVFVIIMLGIAIFGPDCHVRGSRATLQEELRFSYYEAMFFCGGITLLFFTFVSVVLRYQYKRKTNKLQKEKGRLEKLLKTE